jgi:predicted dehydrogenase
VSATGRRLAVGVIGGGYVSQLAHIANLCAYERCDVVGITDLRPELAHKVAARYAIPRVYASHRELLTDPAIDAVVVVTMRPATGPIVLDALQSGRHVLSEKPMAHTVVQAGTLVRAARNRELRYAVGFMKRHDPGVQVARERLRTLQASSELGDLQFVRAYSMHGDVELDVTQTVMSDEVRPGGLQAWPVAPEWLPASERDDYSAFLNVHGHMVNLLRYLFDTTPRVTDAAKRRGPVRRIEFSINAVPLVLEMRDSSAERWTEGVECVFASGSLHLTLPAPFAQKGSGAVFLSSGPDRRRLTPDIGGWAFARQARAWVDDCLDGRTPLASGEDSIEDLIVAESIWRD